MGMSSGPGTRVWTRGRSVAVLAIGLVVLLVSASVSALAGPSTGSISILKFDNEDDELALAGARFELYTNAEPLDPPRGPEDLPTGQFCVTDASGRCGFDVPFGRYWVVETVPPEGYSGGGDFRANINVVTPEWFEAVGNDPVDENVPVNDPAGDTATGDGTNITQSGPSVASDTSGDRVIVAFNDTTGQNDGSNSGIGFAFSRDGGRTFTDGGPLPAGDSLILGDPQVVYDPQTDRFFIVGSGCSLNQANQPGCSPHVSRSTFVQGQPPFQAPPTPIDPNIPPFPAFGHSAHVFVDDQPGSPFLGTVYVIWTRSNADQTSQVFLSRSTDGGLTWDKVEVSPQGTFDFPDATVTPNGRLRMVWSDYGGDAATTFDVQTATSPDGGATVSPPATVAQDVPKSGTPGTCDGQPERLFEGSVRATDEPQVAVNPQDPRQVVTAFTAQGAQPGDASDVVVSVSMNNGQTWEGPLLLTPTDGDQMSPTITWGLFGDLEMATYANRVIEEADTVDLFLSTFILIGNQDPDEAIDFLEQQRVNGVSSTIPPQDPPFDTSATPCAGPGPIGLAPVRSVYVAWTDTRDPGPAGNDGVDPNIYFAHVETPRVPTQTTVDVDKARTKLIVDGELRPSLAGDELTVLLFHDEGDGFDRIGRKRVEVNAKHRYATSFARPDDGRCRVVVKFAGTDDQLKSSARKTFAC